MRTPQDTPQQLALSAELEDELVLKRARELYARSRLLTGRYANFNRLMADPLRARCMRMWARQSMRLPGQGTQGR